MTQLSETWRWRAVAAGPRGRAGALAGGPKEMGARGVAWLSQLVRGKSGERERAA